MKLIEVTVKNFRNIIDSNPVRIQDDITIRWELHGSYMVYIVPDSFCCYPRKRETL